MKAREEFHHHYSHRDEAAKEWKKNGGQVIGYIGEDVPEEMLLAAGFFPLRVTGNPSGSTELADKYMEPAFQPIVRSLFNRLLDGTYAFLDHLIIANDSQAMALLFIYLREVNRVEPRPEIPDFYFYEFLRSKMRTAALYNRDRARDLKTRLEQWAGKEITEGMLREGIALCNENRRLQKQVVKLRAETPPRISGSEVLEVVGSSMFVHKSEHNRMLRRLLAESGEFPIRPATRLYVMGSSLDNLWFYDIVESCNATIVAEDSELGNRYFEYLTDETVDPIDAIVDRYHFRTPNTGRSPIHERVSYVLSNSLEAKAEGAICFILEDDELPGWDYPEQKKALEAAGIPTLCLYRQPYLPQDTEGLKPTLQSFIDSISSMDRLAARRSGV